MTLLPETELLSLLVVIVKLLYPFDELERQVASVSELGFLIIKWDHWINSQVSYKKQRESNPRVSRSRNINVQETDILSLSGHQLDEYLDWYEDTWVEEGRLFARHRHDLMEQVERLFPIGRPEKSSSSKFDQEPSEQALQNAALQKLTSNQAHLKLRRVISNAKSINDGSEQTRRIGTFYKRYKHIGDLPPNAKAFYEAAADFACISLDSLVKAVYFTEVGIISKRRRDKKNGLASDGEQSSEEETEEETEEEMHDPLESNVDAELAQKERDDFGDQMQSDMSGSIYVEDENVQ